jgi:hypothetical protein
MNRLISAALFSLVALAGCDNASRLDKATKSTPTPATGEAAGTSAAPGTGTIEERVARLEANWTKHAEAFDFLAKVHGQQKQQQQQQERSEPAPDAVFAVNIAEDIKYNMVEGPQQALVTIVEAWDFA